jgi:hypothetical protein
MISVKHVLCVLGYDAVKMVTVTDVSEDLSISLFRKKHNYTKNKGINLLRNVGIYMPVRTASRMLYVKFKHICVETKHVLQSLSRCYLVTNSVLAIFHAQGRSYVNFTVSCFLRN